MSDRSRLGDCCQNHDPVTAPVVYPYRVVIDRDSLRGDYRCPACGREWPCWRDMRSTGWTLDDIAGYREHVAVCELDAAFTRNVSERFDGLTRMPDHDGVPTVIDVWADAGLGNVDLTIPDAGIRLNIKPEQAEAIGWMFLSEAARAKREAA